jgi:hypothetical protein
LSANRWFPAKSVKTQDVNQSGIDQMFAFIEEWNFAVNDVKAFGISWEL